MTSPAQLKYLDAIGVPVWVSRDRILQLSELKSPPQKNTSSTDSDCISSVDDILHNLDNPTTADLAVTPKTHNQLTRNEQVPSNTLENSDRAKTNTRGSLNTQINEIGHTDQHTLYACGNLNADWLIIGESPEVNEERQNQPFSTESGVLLNNMLKSIGLQNPRKDAYLINVLKQASPSSDLTQSKLKLSTLLHEKIAEIKPKIILIVGQIAAQNLLQSSEPLARLRSKQHTLPDTNIPLIVTYYPSYLLSKPIDKQKAWADLKLALSCYSKPTPSI